MTSQQERTIIETNIILMIFFYIQNILLFTNFYFIFYSKQNISNTFNLLSSQQYIMTS